MTGFDDFWQAWPKKVKRAQAQDAFRWAMAHHNADGTLLARMLATIAWQRTFYREPRYLPDPNRWLLDRRWEDENPNSVVEWTAQDEADHKAMRARVVAEQDARFAAQRDKFARGA
jgi:hypothetical protein